MSSSSPNHNNNQASVQHSHQHGDHSHPDKHRQSASQSSKPETAKQQRILLISFTIITGFMLVEALGGWLTNSLALLSDAGHMLSDAAALGATLLAFKIGEKAATEKKTFGYKRFEILVAGANGATLVIISLMIIYEAIGRINSPPDIATRGMLIIATVGMLVNILVAWLLHRGGAAHSHTGHDHLGHNHNHNHSHSHSSDHSHNHVHHDHDEHDHATKKQIKDSKTSKNLNMHSAYLHVLGDLLGSVAAIIAALTMMWFGWWWADPVASVIVAILILFSGYRVVKQSVHILMEGTPKEVSLDKVVTTLEAHTAVIKVHDLHIWTITSGLHALSCHVVVDGDMSIHAASSLIHELELRLQGLGISHATMQVESRSCPSMHGDGLVCDLSEHGQDNVGHLGHSH